MRQAGPDTGAAPRRRPDVAAALRRAIVAGRFMPNERLVELDLAARFGANRVQVREALSRLEAEGLVVSEPNRGARVRLVTPAEAIEITEARAAMEALAAAKAAEHATATDVARLDAVLARMRAAIADGDLPGYSALNGDFHAAIRRAARHDTAARMLALLDSQAIRFRFRAILIPGRAARSCAEHEAIAAAIRARDPAGARHAMAAHMAHVVDALREAILARPDPMEPEA